MSSIVLAVCAATPQALAGNVRLWPSAVVVSDTVRLGDVCEITGLDLEVERELSSLVIATAPPTGGSRLIHIDMIRSALAQAGTNMARLILRGATQCAVSRPSNVTLPSTDTASQSTHLAGDETKPRAGRQAAGPPAEIRRLTLRQAVVDHFNSEFARYGGTAEVVFDRTSDQVLDLAGPPYEFKVRRRGGSPLGLTSLEVDVTTNGRIVQTVPLVVQVSMLGRVVAARRAINQGATIRAADVDLVSMSVTRLDKLGFADVALVIGQRAKRFVPTGTLLEPAMLESVPLVRRGDYVKLTSVVGTVRVVTAARATEDGVFGEVITVRAADNKRVEFDAVVAGPGAVQIGTRPPQRLSTAVALGGQTR
ncbi:MAG: flagellar basal body P-ring formation chaperone FlgA [Planctomycetota bacterium]|jgi:flagella basal body P-ring formation protein FlgA